jgi:Zn-finger nucleic acid-binding protein
MRQEEQEAALAFRDGTDNSAAAQPPASARVYIPCPECGDLMNRRNFAGCSHVIIDWCRRHGAWFDRSELHQIVMFIKNGGLRKAREKEKRQLEDEKARVRQQQISLTGGMPVGVAAAVSEFGGDGEPLLQVLSSLWRDLSR